MTKFAALALAAIFSAATAIAADPVRVTKLRLSRVVQYDAPSGKPEGEVQKEQYVPGSWTVLGAPESGYVKISGDGRTFYVRTSAIDTDRRISSSAECGVKVAGTVERIGATRALGEDCK